ncbi:MAG: FAD/NAD(P)-binding oxidoreductase [Chloroherpetonaceae bacterium]|nr:NAD(P)/FAD-dependent oxidoreductase [Chthonomonadaceae bacterium]MDW8209396.1 FAD/NAD(P)-binding oxidoreductase [Chloroherpetonaceae bacterium]
MMRYEYLIVGGGPASVWAAQSIRETDREGRILIVGDEPHPPYDRPPLSKGMIARDNMAVDDPYTKFDDFYPKNAIELMKGVRVTAVDRGRRQVSLADGRVLEYDRLLLATGSRPIVPDIPGVKRPGVYLLRTIEDALAIRAALQQGPRVLVVGGGYIGMEVASSARARGLEVTVVEQAGYPWARFASPGLGRFLQGYYERQGVRFITGESVVGFEGAGSEGPLNAVLTAGGERIPADCAIVGVGAALNVELAQAAGLEAGAGGIRVDSCLQTPDPCIWAAGDVACFPDPMVGDHWHVEHHLNAKWQGQTVGRNMAGARETYDRVAYFFSDVFDIHMILRGRPGIGGHSVFVGDVPEAEFTELYYDDTGRLTMGICISHEEKRTDEVADILEAAIRRGVNIRQHEAAMQRPDFDLATLVE